MIKLKIPLTISFASSHCTQKQLHCLFSLYMYFDAPKSNPTPRYEMISTFCSDLLSWLVFKCAWAVSFVAFNFYALLEEKQGAILIPFQRL